MVNLDILGGGGSLVTSFYGLLYRSGIAGPTQVANPCPFDHNVRCVTYVLILTTSHIYTKVKGVLQPISIKSEKPFKKCTDIYHVQPF